MITEFTLKIKIWIIQVNYTFFFIEMTGKKLPHFPKFPYSDHMMQVGLWIDAGSRYENERNNGTAHFLEHMAFKVRETIRNMSEY